MSTTNPRTGLITLVVSLAIALGAGAWYGSNGTAQVVVAPEGGVAYSTVPETVVVDVSGAVLRPGLVTIRPDGRVADAIAAAGGASVGADLGTLNLAAPLHDGDHVIVPLAGLSGTPVPTEASGVDLNRSTAAELEALPGVGPVLAARIVAYRELNGPFEAVEDLLDVGGIGEAKLVTMRDAIVVP